MQNRKDLLQAHRLMTGRAALALMHGEPDPPDRPLRRLNVGLFSSILVGVIVAAVFGIWGLISPGNAQGLTAAGTLIIDSGTGQSYIWCQGGKLLCPVLNYASARLALGTGSPDVRQVNQASLAHYPRGPEIGIAGLPPLPGSSMLVGQPWSVCVQAIPNPATGQQSTVTTLVGGRGVGGGAVSGGKALLVQATGQDWVIWNGERLLIPALTQQDTISNLTSLQPVPVPAGWLNALPRGPNFAPPQITNFGQAASAGKVGQVFITTAATGARQYYVLLGSGLVHITQTQATLLESEPKAPPLQNVDQSTVDSDLARNPNAISAGGLPGPQPTVVTYTATSPLCAVYTGTATVAPGSPQVTVGGTVPSNGTPTNGAGGVDQIVLPPGTAALVGVVATTQASTGQGPAVYGYWLVTGGLRYGLASPSVAGMLGYTLPGQRTLLPAGVLDLIPQGPSFDPSRAEQQVAS